MTIGRDPTNVQSIERTVVEQQGAQFFCRPQVCFGLISDGIQSLKDCHRHMLS